MTNLQKKKEVFDVTDVSFEYIKGQYSVRNIRNRDILIILC